MLNGRMEIRKDPERCQLPDFGLLFIVDVTRGRKSKLDHARRCRDSCGIFGRGRDGCACMRQETTYRDDARGGRHRPACAAETEARMLRHDCSACLPRPSGPPAKAGFSRRPAALTIRTVPSPPFRPSAGRYPPSRPTSRLAPLPQPPRPAPPAAAPELPRRAESPATRFPVLRPDGGAIGDMRDFYRIETFPKQPDDPFVRMRVQ